MSPPTGSKANGPKGLLATVGGLTTSKGAYPLLEVDIQSQMLQDATLVSGSYWQAQGFEPWIARSPQAQKAVHRLLNPVNEQGQWREGHDSPPPPSPPSHYLQAGLLQGWTPGPPHHSGSLSALTPHLTPAYGGGYERSNYAGGSGGGAWSPPPAPASPAVGSEGGRGRKRRSPSRGPPSHLFEDYRVVTPPTGVDPLVRTSESSPPSRGSLAHQQYLTSSAAHLLSPRERALARGAHGASVAGGGPGVITVTAHGAWTSPPGSRSGSPKEQRAPWRPPSRPPTLDAAVLEAWGPPASPNLFVLPPPDPASPGTPSSPTRAAQRSRERDVVAFGSRVRPRSMPASDGGYSGGMYLTGTSRPGTTGSLGPATPRSAAQQAAAPTLATIIDGVARYSEEHMAATRHGLRSRSPRNGKRSPRGSSGAPPSPHGPHSRPLTPTTIADWDLLLEANRERMMKRIDDVTNLLKLPPADGSGPAIGTPEYIEAQAAAGLSSSGGSRTAGRQRRGGGGALLMESSPAPSKAGSAQRQRPHGGATTTSGRISGSPHGGAKRKVPQHTHAGRHPPPQYSSTATYEAVPPIKSMSRPASASEPFVSAPAGGASKSSGTLDVIDFEADVLPSIQVVLARGNPWVGGTSGAIPGGTAPGTPCDTFTSGEGGTMLPGVLQPRLSGGPRVLNRSSTTAATVGMPPRPPPGSDDRALGPSISHLSVLPRSVSMGSGTSRAVQTAGGTGAPGTIISSSSPRGIASLPPPPILTRAGSLSQRFPTSIATTATEAGTAAIGPEDRDGRLPFGRGESRPDDDLHGPGHGSDWHGQPDLAPPRSPSPVSPPHPGDSVPPRDGPDRELLPVGSGSLGAGGSRDRGLPGPARPSSRLSFAESFSPGGGDGGGEGDSDGETGDGHGPHSHVQHGEGSRHPVSGVPSRKAGAGTAAGGQAVQRGPRAPRGTADTLHSEASLADLMMKGIRDGEHGEEGSGAERGAGAAGGTHMDGRSEAAASGRSSPTMLLPEASFEVSAFTSSAVRHSAAHAQPQLSATGHHPASGEGADADADGRSGAQHVLDLDPLSQSRPGTAGSLKRVGSAAGSRASSAGPTGPSSGTSDGRSVFHQAVSSSGGEAGAESTGASSSGSRNQRAAWPPVPLDESWVVPPEGDGEEQYSGTAGTAGTASQEWHYNQGDDSATTATSDGLFSGSTLHSLPLPGVPEGDGEEEAGQESYGTTEGTAPPDARSSTQGLPQGPVKTAGIGYTVVTSVAVPLVRKEDVQLAARSAALQEVEAGLLDPRQKERVQDASRAARALHKVPGVPAYAQQQRPLPPPPPPEDTGVGMIRVASTHLRGAARTGTSGSMGSTPRTPTDKAASGPARSSSPGQPPRTASSQQSLSTPPTLGTRASNTSTPRLPPPSPADGRNTPPSDYKVKQGITEIGKVHMQDIWAQ